VLCPGSGKRRGAASLRAAAAWSGAGAGLAAYRQASGLLPLSRPSSALDIDGTEIARCGPTRRSAARRAGVRAAGPARRRAVPKNPLGTSTRRGCKAAHQQVEAELHPLVTAAGRHRARQRHHIGEAVGRQRGEIRELPPALRETVVAVDVVGLSYRQAALALGIKQGTIMSRLYRGRERIASQL